MADGRAPRASSRSGCDIFRLIVFGMMLIMAVPRFKRKTKQQMCVLLRLIRFQGCLCATLQIALFAMYLQRTVLTRLQHAYIRCTVNLQLQTRRKRVQRVYTIKRC